jgi:hypothetical protein
MCSSVPKYIGWQASGHGHIVVEDVEQVIPGEAQGGNSIGPNWLKGSIVYTVDQCSVPWLGQNLDERYL